MKQPLQLNDLFGYFFNMTLKLAFFLDVKGRSSWREILLESGRGQAGHVFVSPSAHFIHLFCISFIRMGVNDPGITIKHIWSNKIEKVFNKLFRLPKTSGLYHDFWLLSCQHNCLINSSRLSFPISMMGLDNFSNGSLLARRVAGGREVVAGLSWWEPWTMQGCQPYHSRYVYYYTYRFTN